MSKFSLGSFGHSPDYQMLGIVLIIILFGLVFLSSASSDLGSVKYGSASFFVKNQIIKGIIPGIIGFLAGYFIYYRKWKKVAPLLFLINLILLALIFTPLGYVANGARRWIEIGGFSFQPSEVLKFTYILYLASLLSSAQLRDFKKGWTTYLIFLFVSGVVGILILAQPATTIAVIIIGSGMITYFLSGAPFKHVIVTIFVAIALIISLALISPYRFNRIAPFWNSVVKTVAPSLKIKDIKSDQFHLDQSLIAIGSGGVSGVGLGKSTSKYSVLPEPAGDSIYAVMAEELGFIGSFIVIFLYLYFFWRASRLVVKIKDNFGSLLVIGFISIISIQAIIHIAANSGLLPFTGISLPFISYGGTSLTISMFMVGIMANISRHINY